MLILLSFCNVGFQKDVVARLYVRNEIDMIVDACNRDLLPRMSFPVRMFKHINDFLPFEQENDLFKTNTSVLH